MLKRNLNKFTNVTTLKCVLGAFPFCWFVADRLIFHTFYWFTRITNPDIKPRRISKEPIMEYTTLTALALLILVIISLWFLGRKRQEQ